MQQCRSQFESPRSVFRGVAVLTSRHSGAGVLKLSGSAPPAVARCTFSTQSRALSSRHSAVRILEVLDLQCFWWGLY